MTCLPLAAGSCDGVSRPHLRASHFMGLAFLLTLVCSLTGCAASEDEDKTSSRGSSSADKGDEDSDEEPRRDAGSKAPRPGNSKDDDDEPTVVKPVDGVEKCAGIREEAPPTKGGVDVIFLIDDSGSMIHAIGQVTANMARFVEEFEGSKADTRVVVITSSDPARGSPLASDAERYRFINSKVDSKALFTVALTLFPQYQDFLRPNAATQFVMITDDQDIVPPDVFKQQMEDLLGHRFTQHAVASEDVQGFPCVNEIAKMAGCDASTFFPGLGLPPIGIPALCSAAAVGKAYYTLADQTEGEKLSICKGDWTTIFEQLKTAVIEAVPLPCDYALATASAEKKFDKAKVNIVFKPASGKEEVLPKTTSSDKCGNKAGWFYDDEAAPTTINLCPKACEQAQGGGAIDIEFGCPPAIIF